MLHIYLWNGNLARNYAYSIHFIPGYAEPSGICVDSDEQAYDEAS